MKEKIKKEKKIKKERKDKKYSFKLYQIIGSFAVVLAFGLWIGLLTSGFIYIGDKNQGKEIPYATEGDLKEFVSVFNTIIEEYYEDVDKVKLLDGAISGMLNALGDPYSLYFSEEDTTSFNDQMSGNYAGIGSEISMNEAGQVFISKPFNDSPAMRAGLKVGDIIVEVNGTSMTGLDSSQVVTYIKGDAGTNVTMKVQRGTELLTFTITRAQIVIDTVTSNTYNENGKKIGYIKVDLFAENTYVEFNNKLQALEKENIDSLIIDVRDNSGGYLSIVSNMASSFIPSNKVIYQIQTKDRTEKEYAAPNRNNNRNYPIVVLVNSYSASASEILAGALRESYGATLVGETTFGKGTVQTTKELSDGSMIKYTIQKWLTPNGNSIDKTGIKPDVEIRNTEDYYNNPVYDNDLQLKKAIELISNK